MDKPFPAYIGSDPYIFVCYAHDDATVVYKDLSQLDQSGIRIWYDEGIPAGTSWRAEIVSAIQGATRILFFISASSLHSAHCIREIDYAINHDKEIVPVYLDNSELPAELELVLNRVQALYRKSDTRYLERLADALQNSVSIAPILRTRNKKMKRVQRLVVLAIGIGLIAGIFWTQQVATIRDGENASSSISSASSFDRYLDGLERLERWDIDGNLESAINLFREALELDPGFALAFARLADALRIQYALSGNDAYLEEATDNAEEAARLNDELAPVHVALGRIHAMRGNIDLAYAAFERALGIDPNDAVANQAVAALYGRLGRVDDAESSFKKAIALDPDNIDILNAYANFLYDMSRFEDASRQWQAVIRQAPDHYAALVNLGSVLTELNRLPESISMYQRAIEIRPTYMAFSNLGTAYARAERYGDAVDAYQGAIEIDDSDSLAWGNLAFVYSWMDESDVKVQETFQRAIALAETAREKDSRDAFVHSDLALYYAKTGEFGLARQRLDTAIILAPETGEILAAAAEAFELMGQRDEAIRLAKQSMNFGFSMQQLQRNVELQDLLDDPRMQEQL